MQAHAQKVLRCGSLESDGYFRIRFEKVESYSGYRRIRIAVDQCADHVSGGRGYGSGIYQGYHFVRLAGQNASMPLAVVPGGRGFHFEKRSDPAGLENPIRVACAVRDEYPVRDGEAGRDSRDEVGFRLVSLRLIGSDEIRNRGVDRAAFLNRVAKGVFRRLDFLTRPFPDQFDGLESLAFLKLHQIVGEFRHIDLFVDCARCARPRNARISGISDWHDRP